MNAAGGPELCPRDIQKLPKWRYSVVSEDLYQPELGEYHTYGIQVISSEGMDILHDVSVCKETAAYIVQRLNEYQASPLHQYDVIVDMLP